ncbi:MAG: sigma-70 family RNA polymerase sigma factor [Bacteroidales bacterium]|jgi:RNA polymerase sigma-70 factor (ECF subfamily)
MESQIIKKAISGDSEALTILIDKYKDIAYNLALSIVKNREDARDITQESFLKILENINRFRSDSKFSTWLYRIVYNQSIGYIKRVNRTTMVDYSGLVDISEKNDNQEEKIQDLYKAINLLEVTDRNIIMLFYLAEKSIKEIAQITGFSVGNIKVILHRARKKLFEKMDYENK